MVATKSVRMLRPKRRIEQVWGHSCQDMTDAVASDKLHEAEDKKTLVRCILKLKFMRGTVSPNAGAQFKSAWLLQLAPQGSRVTDPDPSEILDETKPRHIIAHGTYVWTGNGIQPDQFQPYEIVTLDIKGMRKLEVGDQITLSCLAAAANYAVMCCDYTLIFKE